MRRLNYSPLSVVRLASGTASGVLRSGRFRSAMTRYLLLIPVLCLLQAPGVGAAEYAPDAGRSAEAGHPEQPAVQRRRKFAAQPPPTRSRGNINRPTSRTWPAASPAWARTTAAAWRPARSTTRSCTTVSGSGLSISQLITDFGRTGNLVGTSKCRPRRRTR